MRRHYLLNYYNRFKLESDWLLAEFNGALIHIRSDSYNRTAKLTAEMAILRLHDGWARYCREVIVVSAGGRPVTASGIRLPLAPNVRQISDVIPVLLKTYRNRNYEPRWAVSSAAIDAAQRLNIANRFTVIGALGATNSPAEELRHFRNFLAHRGLDTAVRTRQQYTLSRRVRTTIDIVAGAFVPPGISRFEAWVIGLQQIAIATIQ